ETIQFIRSEDPSAPAAVRAQPNQSDFAMYPKLTRLGLDFYGPSIAALGDVQTSGKLETDFYNTATTESREALRIRVAYLQLHWPSFNFYAGQMWDLISPLNPAVNPDTCLWNAGNLGDRRPQARGEWILAPMDASKFFVQGMVGQTGAID